VLRNRPSFNLHKARFPGPILFPKPPLKIKQAYSLATVKFRTRQSAFLVMPDNACLLLRAETPTRPPDRFFSISMRATIADPAGVE
jgi:hypothetical protein